MRAGEQHREWFSFIEHDKTRSSKIVLSVSSPYPCGFRDDRERARDFQRMRAQEYGARGDSIEHLRGAAKKFFRECIEDTRANCSRENRRDRNRTRELVRQSVSRTTHRIGRDLRHGTI